MHLYVQHLSQLNNQKYLKLNNSINLSNVSKSEIQYYSDCMQNMDNSSFDKLICDLISKSSDKEKLKNDLHLLGVEITQCNTKRIKRNAIGSPGEIELYSAKRARDNFYRLIGTYRFNDLTGPETYPGSEDVAIIYYDTSKVSYYDNSSSKAYLKSGNTNNGAVVFNVGDSVLDEKGVYALCAVYVTPKSSSKGSVMSFGTDWIHTYTTYNTSVSMSPSISFGGKGKVSGSIGVNVSISSKEKSWQKGETSRVTLN